MRRSAPPRRLTPLRPGKPPRRYTPLPRPTKPIARRSKLKAALRVADRVFQAAFGSEGCVVGGNCYGPVCGHHSVRRRNLARRHDKENGVPLCKKHHSELHTIGDFRFFKKYPHVPKPKETGEALWLSARPPEAS